MSIIRGKVKVGSKLVKKVDLELILKGLKVNFLENHDDVIVFELIV